MEKRLFALRAATGVSNTPEDIAEKIAALYEEILAKNNISEEDIVSIFFTNTQDIDSINPAAALRRSGKAASLPLFCSAEPHIVGAPMGLIRILLHYYAPVTHSPVFIYRNGAQMLRPDLCK